MSFSHMAGPVRPLRVLAAVAIGAALLAPISSGAVAAERQAVTREAAMAQPGAFDVDQLHPEVRRAALAAREAAARAEAAAVRARAAADAAESAAERARQGAPGTRADRERDGDLYEGEIVSRFGYWARQGHGVFSGGGALGSLAGAQVRGYSGQWRSGVPDGAGVLLFAAAESDPAGPERYEGEHARGWRRDVFGVYFWRSGQFHAGGWRDGVRSGPGVHVHPDGHRFEGEFANDSQNGYGVMWKPDGSVLWAGTFKDGKPVQRLTR